VKAELSVAQSESAQLWALPRTRRLGGSQAEAKFLLPVPKQKGLSEPNGHLEIIVLMLDNKNKKGGLKNGLSN